MSKGVRIGFFVDGGLGSHPGILSPGAVSFMGKKSGDYPMFWITSEEEVVPEALACVYNERDDWDIWGISGALGVDIMKLIDGDNITSEHDGSMDMLNEVCSMLGYRRVGVDEFTSVTIIPNPVLDVVYWSDEPGAQSWWSPPYEAKSVWDLLGFGGLAVPGVSLSRLLPRMRYDGVI